MTNAEEPVVVRALVKRYGAVVAVDHVDLTVHAGDVYGFLGPNGAGKTTSLRMLLGLVRPTAGTVRVFGHDPATDPATALRSVAGFVESPAFYPYLTGRANLELVADYTARDARGRIGEALETVDLADRARDRVGGYSFGMRQRLGIAAALVRKPRLLVLDEPTTGLDPAGMRDMRTLVRGLVEQGITVLLSSHLMDEVEDLCNRVAIINHGRIIHEGALHELLSEPAHYHLNTTDNAAAAALATTLGIAVRGADPSGLSLSADRALIDQLTIRLGSDAIAIRGLAQSSTTLADRFFQLTEPSAAGAQR